MALCNRCEEKDMRIKELVDSLQKVADDLDLMPRSMGFEYTSTREARNLISLHK